MIAGVGERLRKNHLPLTKIVNHTFLNHGQTIQKSMVIMKKFKCQKFSQFAIRSFKIILCFCNLIIGSHRYENHKQKQKFTHEIVHRTPITDHGEYYSLCTKTSTFP